MSDAEIIELMRKALEGEMLVDWWFYVLLVPVALVASAVGNYLGAYFRTRGSRFATKADFDELLSEVRETTKATEEVKHRVSHEAWLERERSTIRREKLEELLLAVYELHQWLDREKDHGLFGDSHPNDLPDPTYKLTIVGQLFFEELAEELVAVKKAGINYKMWLADAKGKLLEARLTEDRQAELDVVRKATEEFGEVYSRLLSATRDVEAKAKRIMQEAFGKSPDCPPK